MRSGGAQGPQLRPGGQAPGHAHRGSSPDYGDFEGVSLKGSTAAARCSLGPGHLGAPEDPHKATARVQFRLQGEKPAGGWTLVKIRRDARDDEKSWLLIKENDETAQPAAKFPSRTSGRERGHGPRPETIARERDAVGSRRWWDKPARRGWRPKTARKAAG